MVKITKREPPPPPIPLRLSIAGLNCRVLGSASTRHMNISIVRMVQKGLNLPHSENLLFVGSNLVSYPTVCHTHLYSNSSQWALQLLPNKTRGRFPCVNLPSLHLKMTLCLWSLIYKNGWGVLLLVVSQWIGCISHLALGAFSVITFQCQQWQLNCKKDGNAWFKCICVGLSQSNCRC